MLVSFNFCLPFSLRANQNERDQYYIGLCSGIKKWPKKPHDFIKNLDKQFWPYSFDGELNIKQALKGQTRFRARDPKLAQTF